jgi:hypothetical protein
MESDKKAMAPTERGKKGSRRDRSMRKCCQFSPLLLSYEISLRNPWAEPGYLVIDIYGSDKLLPYKSPLHL